RVQGEPLLSSGTGHRGCQVSALHTRKKIYHENAGAVGSSYLPPTLCSRWMPNKDVTYFHGIGGIPSLYTPDTGTRAAPDTKPQAPAGSGRAGEHYLTATSRSPEIRSMRIV